MNAAENMPEDRAAGIRTVAAALGMKGCLGLSAAMVGAGGLGTLGALGWMLAGQRLGARGRGVDPGAARDRVGVGGVADRGDLQSRGGESHRGGGARGDAAPGARDAAVITATAWTALFAAWRVGAEW